MAPAALAEAVRRVAGRAVTEASGNVTPERAPAIAATGVDLISAGWLTHSAAGGSDRSPARGVAAATHQQISPVAAVFPL